MDALRVEIAAGIAEGVDEAAEDILEFARMITPVVSGNLQEGWVIVEADEGGYVLENDVEYFWYVYGRNMDFRIEVDGIPEKIAETLAARLA